jgi:aspartyl-tRNA(Asn)/glutamyl-tRNA(Gln) amidotransferase subunit A
VFGFKATHGTIAAWPPSTIGTMSNVGPITRTATDAALMMEAIGRPDPRDPNVVQLPPSRYRATLEAGIDDLRIAYAPRFNRADVDEEVADGVARAVGMLETMGAHVEEIDPELGDIESAFSVLWAAGIESGLSVMTDPERQLLEPELDDLAKSARSYSAMDLLAAARTRELLGIMMNGLHERYDLLVMPAVCVPAFDVGRDSPDTKRYPNWWNWAPFSYPFNLTMQPAASIRCGWTDDALPIGLQIIGRRWADGLVLRACRALERILSGSGHAVPWI